MQDSNFDFVSNLVKQKSGLVLSKDKIYLLESRLAPIARQEKLDDADTLLTSLRTKPNQKLNDAVVEAMTTNETFFFRDNTPFDIFQNCVLPHMVDNRPATHKLRLWCAAASTGQEPYSLRMILNEQAVKMGGRKTEIVGTDISDKVLEKAKSGIYTQFEVQRGLPMARLVKNFDQQGQNWVIKPELRASINYRKFNLLDSYASLGKWDIVFCRNVLIYFDQPTKADIMKRISQQLAPDGFLFLGAAETTIGISSEFTPVKGMRGLYQLQDAEPTKFAKAS
jgi:chemotaxis protein methyltransferase CheR